MDSLNDGTMPSIGKETAVQEEARECFVCGNPLDRTDGVACSACLMKGRVILALSGDVPEAPGWAEDRMPQINGLINDGQMVGLIIHATGSDRHPLAEECFFVLYNHRQAIKAAEVYSWPDPKQWIAADLVDETNEPNSTYFFHRGTGADSTGRYVIAGNACRLCSEESQVEAFLQSIAGTVSDIDNTADELEQGGDMTWARVGDKIDELMSAAKELEAKYSEWVANNDL